MCVGVLPAGVSVYCMCAVLLEPEESVRPPGFGVTGSCEPPGRCWESNSDSREEQQVFLTAATGRAISQEPNCFYDTFPAKPQAHAGLSSGALQKVQQMILPFDERNLCCVFYLQGALDLFKKCIFLVMFLSLRKYNK